MTAIETILASLTEVFKPFDAEAAARARDWAKSRVTALREFKETDEYKAMAHDSWRVYPRLFAIAGGKTWYNSFQGRNASMIDEMMDRNSAAVARKRQEAIAAKLHKAGVTSLLESGTIYTYSPGGFNGVFVVDTDKGVKHVNISTIRAGGYNIPCLHLRVLVHVK